MEILLIAAGVMLAMYGLHRLALFAESKSWIFYTVRPPRVKMLGLLEELVDPRVEYLVEEQSSEAIQADHESSGDGNQATNAGERAASVSEKNSDSQHD